MLCVTLFFDVFEAAYG